VTRLRRARALPAACRCDTDAVENLAGWLTTVIARVCLDRLRSRRARPEDPADVDRLAGDEAAAVEPDPEQETLLADSVGSAVVVVLDLLAPGDRVAFVLHDVFAVPFDEIGEIVGRSDDAARQLASRARRRVHGMQLTRAFDLVRQR
jgi:RNA polymerase sigma-70 factor, ECF subfamily